MNWIGLRPVGKLEPLGKHLLVRPRPPRPSEDAPETSRLEEARGPLVPLLHRRGRCLGEEGSAPNAGRWTTGTSPLMAKPHEFQAHRPLPWSRAPNWDWGREQIPPSQPVPSRCSNPSCLYRRSYRWPVPRRGSVSATWDAPRGHGEGWAREECPLLPGWRDAPSRWIMGDDCGKFIGAGEIPPGRRYDAIIMGPSLPWPGPPVRSGSWRRISIPLWSWSRVSSRTTPSCHHQLLHHRPCPSVLTYILRAIVLPPNLEATRQPGAGPAGSVRLQAGPPPGATRDAGWPTAEGPTPSEI